MNMLWRFSDRSITASSLTAGAQIDDEERKATRLRVAAWRHANPARAKEIDKASYLRNVGSRREAKRAYYQRVRRFRDKTEEGRLKGRIKKENRRITGRGTVTKDEWIALCESYDHRCAYCRLKARLTMDHVVALTKGGSHLISNIVPACQSCNSSKGDRETPKKVA